MRGDRRRVPHGAAANSCWEKGIASPSYFTCFYLFLRPSDNVPEGTDGQRFPMRGKLRSKFNQDRDFTAKKRNMNSVIKISSTPHDEIYSYVILFLSVLKLSINIWKEAAIKNMNKICFGNIY